MMNTIAKTLNGELRGVEAENTISWRGIRYANPPAGSGRWQPPEPCSPWTGVLPAEAFSTRSPQVLTPELLPPGGAIPSDAETPFGEDCLFLNITAPRSSAEASHPVLVWFHGGGYTWGSGAHFIGDGTALALGGIIVVTVNYRLGALGFLKLDHLLGPGYGSAANVGLLDQVAALKWVKENIEAFGGDASRITIAGVSAGAKSVANLMATPLSEGLFHRGIIQSGGEHLNTPETAASLTASLLVTLGLSPDNAPKILTVPPEDLLQAQQEIASGVRSTWLWRPTLDGHILPEAPIRAFTQGRAKSINVLAGVTANEAVSYDLADPTAADQTPRVLREIFGDQAEKVLEAYRISLPSSADDRAVHRAVMADERYGIPTIRLLDAQSAHASCWRYRFDAPTPRVPEEKWGMHGADVPYVWDVGFQAAEAPLRELADEIRQTWTSFVADGKPQAAGLPFWPEYETTERWTMLLDVVPRITSDPRPEQRQAWAHAQWQPGTWWQLISAPPISPFPSNVA